MIVDNCKEDNLNGLSFLWVRLPEVTENNAEEINKFI